MSFERSIAIFIKGYIKNPVKLFSIHENPVRKDYVFRPEHWPWSSANLASPILIKLLAT
jgi:hypothetical protein